MSARILYLDLETSPNLAHVWGLWQQNIAISQLEEHTHVICFGARWAGTKTVIFKSVHHDGRKAMLDELHHLMDEADIVVGWNSQAFDVKHIRRELLEAGYTPPSPWRDLDLMKVVKQQFKMPSNKLDYVAQLLGVGSKTKHTGFQLWLEGRALSDVFTGPDSPVAVKRCTVGQFDEFCDLEAFAECSFDSAADFYFSHDFPLLVVCSTPGRIR